MELASHSGMAIKKKKRNLYSKECAWLGWEGGVSDN